MRASLRVKFVCGLIISGARRGATRATNLVSTEPIT